MIVEQNDLSILVDLPDGNEHIHVQPDIHRNPEPQLGVPRHLGVDIKAMAKIERVVARRVVLCHGGHCRLLRDQRPLQRIEIERRIDSPRDRPFVLVTHEHIVPAAANLEPDTGLARHRVGYALQEPVKEGPLVVHGLHAVHDIPLVASMREQPLFL